MCGAPHTDVTEGQSLGPLSLVITNTGRLAQSLLKGAHAPPRIRRGAARRARPPGSSFRSFMRALGMRCPSDSLGAGASVDELMKVAKSFALLEPSIKSTESSLAKVAHPSACTVHHAAGRAAR